MDRDVMLSKVLSDLLKLNPERLAYAAGAIAALASIPTDTDQEKEK